MVLLYSLLLVGKLLLKVAVLALHREDRVIGRIDFPLPVSLHASHLDLPLPQYLLERKELFLELLLLHFNLAGEFFKSGSFIADLGLSVLDLMHVLAHLILEIVLKVANEVVLDVGFLDLGVDCFELRVHF